MSKVLILQGLIASGKTTIAKDLVINEGYKRVNKDDIRAMVDCSKFSKPNEQMVLDVRDTIIDMALMFGRNIVVDDTNFEQKHIDRIREIAKLHDAEVEIRFVNANLTDCIERDAKRENSIGSSVILAMYNRYLAKEVEVVADLPTAIVCDIDGTLAKMVGRNPFDWSRVGEDKVNVPVRNILQTYANKSGTKIIILSGRDGGCINETREWLHKNSIPFDSLHLRAHGDSRKDNLVKLELYKKHIQGQYNVLFVLDDRNQVVDMWRSIGLTCLQVDYGNF